MRLDGVPRVQIPLYPLMSTFTDRLNSRRNTESRRIHSPEYIEAVWLLMIACGGVLLKQDEITEQMEEENSWSWKVRDHIASYYGSGDPNCDYDKTVELIELIREHGVNFEASQDPSEDTWPYFAGTFTDHQYEYGMLWGKLVLGNGDFFWLAAKCEDFGRLVRVLNLDLNLEEALENLEERLTDPMYQKDYTHSLFGYSCTIPEF